MTTDAKPLFILFGSEHMVTMLIIASASIVLPMAVRRSAPRHLQNLVAVILATVVVAHELLRIWVRVHLHGEPLVAHLPLHLCGIATFLTAYVLIRRSYSAFEIVYFWGLGGTLQAILTPDLQTGFPSLVFVTFFAGHGLVILGVFYAILVYQFKPTLHSVFKTIAVTLGYMALIAPLNIALGTNYLYLRHKPQHPSLMDYFGPWPWYILGLIAAGVVSCFAYYAPFALLTWRSRRKEVRAKSQELTLGSS